MAEREDELSQKPLSWKSATEARRLAVNASKIEMMLTQKCNKVVTGHVEYLWGMCSKNLRSNSEICVKCSKGIYKQCNGI